MLNRSQAEVLSGLEERSAGSIFALGLNGPFLPQTIFPKLESSLSLGYQKNETPGINDTSSSRFVGSLNVSWHARERTRVFLDARRALVLSVNDLTVETTGFNVGVNQSIGDFTTASLSAGYEQREYQTVDLLGRTDDVYMLQTSARYRITSAWSAAANYSLREAQSSEAVADYGRHLVSVEATYTF